MKVILATRNRYLEYGLQALLKEHSVILAREFFLPPAVSATATSSFLSFILREYILFIPRFPCLFPDSSQQ